MSVLNPFEGQRFEQEARHLIWVSPKIDAFSMRKPIYLPGVRGSGKTSLLKSIDWRERFSNKTLQGQDSRLPANVMGIYVNIPLFVTEPLDKLNWADVFPNAPDAVISYYQYFSLILETAVLEQLCLATQEFRLAKRLTYSVDDEMQCVEEIFAKFEVLKLYLKRPLDGAGLPDLADCFRRLQRRLLVSATRGVARQAILHFETELAGDLLYQIGDIFGKSVLHSIVTGIDSEFQIKICLDDGEFLSPQQQVFVNTLVRSVRAPFSWAVAFAEGGFDTVSVLNPAISATHHDRVIHPLKDPDRNTERKNFETMCMRISALRVYYAVERRFPDPSFFSNSMAEEYFDFIKFLGEENVNTLIMKSIRGSRSPRAEVLRKRAEELRETKAFANDYPEDPEASGGILPYYEAYILSRLYPTATIVDLVDGGKIPSIHSYLRRKQVGAFYCLAAEHRFQGFYVAGAMVVQSLADSAIRDFLEIMSALFDEHQRKGRHQGAAKIRRRQSPLRLADQHSALARASEACLAGTEVKARTNGPEVRQLIDCLGRLVHLLQTKNVFDALRHAERGIFEVRFRGSSRPGSEEERLNRRLAKVIAMAIEMGALRAIGDDTGLRNIERSDKGIVTFRLHRRLSVHFRFSYRGPYGVVKLDSCDFHEIFRQPELLEPTTWAIMIYDRLRTGDDTQQILPFENDDFADTETGENEP